MAPQVRADVTKNLLIEYKLFWMLQTCQCVFSGLEAGDYKDRDETGEIPSSGQNLKRYCKAMDGRVSRIRSLLTVCPYKNITNCGKDREVSDWRS